MNKMSNYLKHLDDSSYLPKEQLRRMIKFLNLKTEGVARVLGLASGTINVLKSFSAVTTQFKKTHAVKLINNRPKKKDFDHSPFREEIAIQGFLITYDETTWHKRIALAAEYQNMDDYNADIDNYLRMENPNPFLDSPENIIVISLQEVATFWRCKPHEVLQSIIEEYHNTDETDDDSDDW